MLLDFLEPGADIQERLLVAQVEHDDDSVSALVVSIRYRAVPFLAGRVPNLQLDIALVDLQSAESEVHTDCRYVVL